MKRHIPNTLTCLNLFFGCIAVVYAFEKNIEVVFYCILISGICDFFDGMAARALHVKSTIGKELDSLADMVSFGFVPGVVFFMMLKDSTNLVFLPYLGFLVTVFSALRLAKFNVDERQSQDFIGLNTPMNTFFVLSLPFIGRDFPDLVYSPYMLILIVGMVSYLLVSEVRLFSMKLSSPSWEKNKFQFIFVILTVTLVVFLKFIALPLVLLSYIIFSKLHFLSSKP
ncbi:phosphatidylcholine/phosphatidylserine synthase [Sphingobacterium sp. JB170]|uniref:CDP-alcohol phosphatidyltransferase family protein n=1 Tax=Sphingobacterium sp. JB170 TaxID=1434842 RepID=UPI00097F5811|nr:CDP-alcohol phosphatidyltransferase family protein [Sphingobacterium sp. JB170]SJN17081.1 CDP-diacylglycerol--serine O-phosphatidyltransferase [Sphingobacterium sp. JB170]